MAVPEAASMSNNMADMAYVMADVPDMARMGWGLGLCRRGGRSHHQA